MSLGFKKLKKLFFVFHISLMISLFAVCSALALSNEVNSEDEALVITGEESLSANYLAGRFAQNQRDYGTSALFFQRTLADDPKNIDLLEKAFLLNYADGNIGEALQLAQRMTKARPNNKLALMLSAMNAAKNNRPQTALQILEKVGASAYLNGGQQQENAPDITSSMLKAWVSLGVGKKSQQTQRALEILDKLKGPEWVELYKLVHSALIVDMQKGTKKNPNQYLPQLILKLPVDFQAVRLHEVVLTLMIREGQYDAAISRWNSLPKPLQNHPSLQKLYTFIQSKADLPPFITNYVDGTAEVFFNLGAILSSDSDEDLAAIYIYTSVYLKPNFDIAWMALGEFYQDTKVPARAIESFRHIGKDSIFYLNARIELADHLSTSGETAEAELILKKLAETFPNAIEPRSALGSLYRQVKKYELAITEYTKAIDKLITLKTSDLKPIENNKTMLESKHWVLYYYRGMSYERIQKLELAENDLKQALILHENDPSLLNYLGYIMIDQGKDLETAKTYIEKAVMMRPNNGYYLDSLAWLHFKMNNYEVALQHAQAAVRLNPNDPVILDHYADILWKSGHKIEARYNWQHARSLPTDEVNLHNTIQKKLETGL